ncbi:T9SS type A sorting domain-containing protein [Chryseobacterium antibioticum]|uniref:T9SS type A sorting domain-containing protein n=1 Tax=Chryseobacterium pyrolae TaxID=2987481 RepID=A0ABT2IDH1_9FLAO|nr:T9SS type A sorting domain-containing protein [Chryseobacterium pyrolae]MCT2406656.1 T9SS type A sorting domain-containing protein [Chryseobacterium pyrolae]
MKKILLANLLMISTCAFAQTYCIPEFSSGCDGGDMIDSFTIPSAGFSHLDTGCSQGAYGDYTSQTINMNAGVNYAFSIVHDYSNQNVRVWIDFDNNGTFDDAAPELVAAASSVGPDDNSITNGSIIIPATVTPGTYRMRVGDRYSSQPEPCNTSGYGEAHDYTVTIGAAPSCLAPSNLSSSAVTSSSASVAWTASTSTVGVGYEYYYSQTNTAPTSTTAATGSVGASSTSVPLSTLSSATTYYVWVRSVCSASDKSAWSIGTSFTTLCAVVVPSVTYTNDFSTFPGNCWEQASGGDASTGPDDTEELWFDGDFLNSGDNAAKINLYFTGTKAWLKTVPFNLSAGGYRVKFDYGVTEFLETTASAMGSDDVVQFLVSGDGGSTWTVLQTWNNANGPSNTSTAYSYNLTSYTGANTIFAFYASDGSVNDPEDYEFFVDNFKVESASLATSEVSKAKEDIKAYPNPFTDVLNISKADLVKSVSVSDVSGRLVKTIDTPSSALHLGDLKQGLYFVTLNMKDGSKQMIKAIKK